MSGFQQRHYEAIADTINDSYWHTADDNVEAIMAIRMVEHKLAIMFQADNPRFKESVFTSRCERGQLTS